MQTPPPSTLPHPHSPRQPHTNAPSPTATIYTSWWRKFIAAWDIRGTFWRQIGGKHVPEKCARASYFQRRVCLCLCNFHLLCQVLSQCAPSVQLVVYSEVVSRASLSPHPLVPGVARGWPARMESVICRMESVNEDKLECQHVVKTRRVKLREELEQQPLQVKIQRRFKTKGRPIIRKF